MTGRHHSRRGFTLIELLIGATLAAFALAALLAGFVFLARNFARMANSQALEQQGRTALAYLEADLAVAVAVKRDTSPTATSLVLQLPAGDVTYSYDSAGARLRRQASFGTVTDLSLLANSTCRCTAFAFSYFTGTQGSPADPLAPGTNVPLSIKQIQATFALQTPGAAASETRMGYAVVSPRLHLRNKRKPDGH